MKIKTIIFVNHGVITSSTTDGATEKFARFLGVDYAKFKHAWEELESDVDEGKITNEEFLKSLISKTGSQADLEGFRRLYFSSYYPKKDVQEFAKNLGKKFEIALLTNFSDAFDKANKKWKLEKIFGDNIFVSGKLKMRKPNEDIYLYVLKKLGRKPEETVFIDDNEEFVSTAKKLGMHTILFKSLEQVEKELEDILVAQGQSLYKDCPCK
jgi:putative hydrolase of the HAD superfamily